MFKTIGDRKLDPHLIYRLQAGVDHIRVCTSARALRSIRRPNAREVMDDAQFTRTVMLGGCGSMGGPYPIVIERQTKEFSVVRQHFANVDGFSRSGVVWNSDLVGYDGLAPHDIKPNELPPFDPARDTQVFHLPLMGNGQ